MHIYIIYILYIYKHTPTHVHFIFCLRVLFALVSFSVGVPTTHVLPPPSLSPPLHHPSLLTPFAPPPLPLPGILEGLEASTTQMQVVLQAMRRT